MLICVDKSFKVTGECEYMWENSLEFTSEFDDILKKGISYKWIWWPLKKDIRVIGEFDDELNKTQLDLLLNVMMHGKRHCITGAWELKNRINYPL